MKRKFTNDSVLLKELKMSNDQALIYIMDNYHKPLCLYAYSLSNDHDGAKDIVQNVLITIWERRKILPEITHFKNYLYKSVYNEFLNKTRGSGRMMIFEKEYFEGLNNFVNDQDENETKKLLKILNNEIENLPPKCKETFLLCKKDGLTYIEVADYLNVSIKTVEAHMNKAFHELRMKMKEKINTIILFMFGIAKKI